jgi:translocation and assembly module TamA
MTHWRMQLPRSVAGFAAAALLCAAMALAPSASAAPKKYIDIRVDGVPDDIAENIRSYLTLSRYTERTDLNDKQVRRLADRAVDEATDALRPFGYYKPVIKSRTSFDEPNWIVRLRVQPGEPVRMTTVDVQIVGPGAADRELRDVPEASTLQPGTRLDHTAYESLKTSLMRTARDRGFLDATLTRRELIVNPVELTAEAHIALETGGRYEFGAIEIEQRSINEDLLQGFVRFKPGQPYSPALLNSTQYALEDSFYFSSVTVTPGERDPDSLTVPVRITADPVRKHRYAVSAGYGTDTGIRGQFTWDNRLVNSRGHRMRTEITASELRSEAVTRYIIPVGDPSLEKLDRVHRRGDRRSRQHPHRTDGQPDAGLRALAAGDVPAAQPGRNRFSGRQLR